MDSLFDIHDLCRLCTCKTQVHNRIHIFNVEGQTREVNLKISSCLPVSVSEADFLPKFVCMACVNQLDSYYKFREFSLKSESYLLSLVKRQSQNLKAAEDDVCSSNDVESVDTSASRFCQIQYDSNGSKVNKSGIENIECEPCIEYNKNGDEDSGRLSPSEAEAHRLEFLRRLSTLYAPRNKQTSSPVLKKSRRNVPTVHTSAPVHNTRSILRSSLQQTAGVVDAEDKVSAKSQQDEINEKTQRKSSRSLLNNKTKDCVSTAHKQQAIAMLQCDYCKLLFANRTVFIDHIRSMHQRIFKCNKCGDTFKTRSQLKLHNKKHIQKIKRERAERKNKKCNVCGKEYLHNKDLRLHERSHTGERPFSCTYCEKCFSSSSARNKHIQVHEKRWSHVCSYCGKGFVDKIHFVYHVQKHHTGERPFPCTQCEKKFVRKHDLLMHEANMHSTEPRQCYKCEICSKTFTNKSYLKTHTQNHVIPIESRKKFKCNICDAVFCSKRNSIQHTLTHTGELPYECDLCKKRFNNKHGLEIHLLIHSGLKKFICEVCGKAFALQNTLVCHRRTHTGERPYQCDICDQRFTQKSSLNAHRKRHVRD